MPFVNEGSWEQINEGVEFKMPCGPISLYQFNSVSELLQRDTRDGYPRHLSGSAGLGAASKPQGPVTANPPTPLTFDGPLAG